MITPIHKIDLYITAIHDPHDIEEIKNAIQNLLEDYGMVSFGKCEVKDAGEWHDEHKLNHVNTNVAKYYEKLK